MASPMTDEDRQAWRDMAGPEFQSWMQQEMGIAMARLNMRGFMETTKEELEKLKDGQLDQADWLRVLNQLTEIHKGTRDVLNEIMAKVSGIEARLGLLQTLGTKIMETAPEAPPAEVEPEKIQTPRLTPRQHKVLDYIAQHPKCNQSAMVFHLEISKTTLSEILSELFELDLVSRVRIATNNGGHTYSYTATNTTIPMLPPDATPPPAQNKTTIGQIADFLRDQPWSTAAQVHAGVHWLGPVPPVNTVAAALSNGVKDAKFQVLHGEKGQTKYALFGAPSEKQIMVEAISHAPIGLIPEKPTVPPKLNLFEQIVVKTLKNARLPLTPQEISNQAREKDFVDIQINSVRSVCGRLLARGILETRFAGDRSVVHYQLA